MDHNGEKTERSLEARTEEHSETRRTFLRMLATGGLAALGPTTPATAFGITRPDDSRGAMTAALPWRRTIFCQLGGAQEHGPLLEALAKSAVDLDCGLVIGTDGHPDIFAIGCFVQVIDRNAVGEEMWRDYVAAYEHAGDVTPCFIVDDRKDLPLPDWKFVRQVDTSDPDGIAVVTETIREMKAEMNRRLPGLFKSAENIPPSGV